MFNEIAGMIGISEASTPTILKNIELIGRNKLVWPRKFAHSGFSSLVHFFLTEDNLFKNILHVKFLEGYLKYSQTSKWQHV